MADFVQNGIGGFTHRWLNYFFTLAQAAGDISKDPSTKVGAVIVKDKYVLGTGFNGFPCGVHDDQKEYSHRYERPIKYDYTAHAEANALMQCCLHGRSTKDATIFVTHQPCIECTKLLIQAGIKQIFFNNYTLPPKDGYDPADWRSKLSLAENMCSEAGVIFYGFDKQLNLVNSNADLVLL